MMKHMIGQSILQIIIMVILVFWGELFIPEAADTSYEIFWDHPEWMWRNGEVGGTVCSGRMSTIAGQDDYKTCFDKTGIYSRHFTFIFNAFVMLQIFNFVNCRKIHD
jgi:Ca2+ transporting ATPase